MASKLSAVNNSLCKSEKFPSSPGGDGVGEATATINHIECQWSLVVVPAKSRKRSFKRESFLVVLKSSWVCLCFFLSVKRSQHGRQPAESYICTHGNDFPGRRGWEEGTATISCLFASLPHTYIHSQTLLPWWMPKDSGRRWRRRQVFTLLVLAQRQDDDDGGIFQSMKEGSCGCCYFSSVLILATWSDKNEHGWWILLVYFFFRSLVFIIGAFLLSSLYENSRA